MKSQGRSLRTRPESVAVQFLPPNARDEEVARLDRPWVAEEGPLAVRFVRLEPGATPELQRGVAFDGEKTVSWDESAVTVLSPAPPDGQTVAFEHDVLVREKFPNAPRLQRVDYIRNGVWQGSRYLARGASHA